MEETRLNEEVFPEPAAPDAIVPLPVEESMEKPMEEPAAAEKVLPEESEEKLDETILSELEQPLPEVEEAAEELDEAVLNELLEVLPEEEALPEERPLEGLLWEEAEEEAEKTPELPPKPKKKRKPLTTEQSLGSLALICAAVLAVVVFLSMPYFGQDEEDPELVIHRNPPATQPAEESTEPGTTEPEPDRNPYGKLDFQYEGRYLGCLKADTMPGIDVSYYQGDIDWEAVKASGIEFAIVRLGYRGYGKEGKLVEDKNAYINIEGALEAGLKVGIYFFSQAISPEEAVEEAEYVLERIEAYELTMPIVYDWEYISAEARTANVDRRTLTDCTLAFCRTIAEAGYTPMAYFNSYQSRNQLYLTELEEYPFWLAFYTDRMTYPYRVEMWQYTDSGRVPGIEGYVDLNLCFLEE